MPPKAFHCKATAKHCKHFVAVDLLVFAGVAAVMFVVLPPLVSPPLNGCRLPLMAVTRRKICRRFTDLTVARQLRFAADFRRFS